jgi:hypothetical protein
MNDEPTDSSLVKPDASVSSSVRARVGGFKSLELVSPPKDAVEIRGAGCVETALLSLKISTVLSLMDIILSQYKSMIEAGR